MADEVKQDPISAGDASKYEFGVQMSCGGCSGAINRVLTKLEGVKSHEVSLESQTAVVYAEPSLSYQTVLEKIQKTNKKLVWGKENGEERSVEKVEAVEG